MSHFRRMFQSVLTIVLVAGLTIGALPLAAEAADCGTGSPSWASIFLRTGFTQTVNETTGATSNNTFNLHCGNSTQTMAFDFANPAARPAGTGWDGTRFSVQFFGGKVATPVSFAANDTARAIAYIQRVGTATGKVATSADFHRVDPVTGNATLLAASAASECNLPNSNVNACTTSPNQAWGPATLPAGQMIRVTLHFVDAGLAGAFTLRYNGSSSANATGDRSIATLGGSTNTDINKNTPLITWANPADITYPTALSGTQLNASANVAGSFVYNPASGTVLNAGAGQSLSTTFTPTDTANYTTAQKSVSINVLKAATTTSVSCPESVSHTGQPRTPCTASVTGPNLTESVAVTYTENTAVGTATASASYPGGPNHLGSSGQSTFVIEESNKSPQTITFNSPGDQYVGDTAEVSASSDSDLPVTITSTTPDVCTVADGVVTMLSTGTCTLQASQGGNDDFEEATPVLVSFEVTPVPAAPTTLTVSSDGGTYGGTATLTATLTSDGSPVAGKTVTFTFNGEVVGTAVTDANGVATLNDVALTAAGTYGLTAAFDGDDGHEASNADGSVTVAKANATVTADDKSSTYGETAPTFTYTVSGLVNGDEHSAITGVSCASGTGTAGQHSIICSGPDQTDNYDVSYVDGTWSIGKAATSVEWADPEGITYGTPLGDDELNADFSVDGNCVYTPAAGTVLGAGTHTLSVTCTPADGDNYEPVTMTVEITVGKAATSVEWADPEGITYGTPLGDDELNADFSVEGNCVYTPAAGTVLGAGTHTLSVTCTPADGDNYEPVTMTVEITVGQASATVTADNQSKTYGDADPVFTYTTSGVVDGDELGAITCGVEGDYSDVGDYAITCSGADNTNYDVTYVDGELSVGQADAVVTADDQSKTYGDADPAFTYTTSGVVDGDELGAITCGVEGDYSDVGDYAITCSGADNTNYDVTYVDGELSVGQAEATVTAENQSKTYGDADPAFTYTASGVLGDDELGDITCVVAGDHSDVGDYAITCSGADNTNYDVAYVDGTLTVGQAEATVTADDQSKTYGDANPALTYTVSGLVNGDDASVVTGVDCSTDADESSAVGTYAITCAGGDADNYDVTYVAGTLTVGQAEATVTAENQSKTYGDADPAFTYTTSGVVDGDELGAITCGVEGDYSDVGDYAITCSGADNTNYDVTYVDGELSVGQAEATVTAENQSKTYGDADPAFTYTASGVLGDDELGDITCAVAGDHSNVGDYAITCSGADNTNYDVAYVDGTLTVGQADATVTADDQSKTYGDADPAFTYTASGVLGDELGAITCGVEGDYSDVGDYAITCSGADNTNYDVEYTAGTLTVNQRAVTVTADEKSKVFGNANPAFTFTTNWTDPAGACLPTVDVDSLATQSSAVGTYAITATGDTETTNCTITYSDGVLTVTARPVPMTIGAAPLSVQYSDQVTLTANFSESTVAEVALQGTAEFFVRGVSVGTQPVDGDASVTLTVPFLIEPGAAGIRVDFTPSAGSSFAAASTNGVTVTVTREDARTESRTESLVYGTTGSGGGKKGSTTITANVALAVNVADITAVGDGDPAYDDDPGNIGKATVTFRSTDDKYGCTAVVGVADLANPTTGGAACLVNLPGNANDGITYEFVVTVGGWYQNGGAVERILVTVAPEGGTGFITGGGYNVLSNPAGVANGRIGSKSNFGFNVKYNKQQTNLQGSVNTIIRSADGRLLQVKTNAMQSLVTKQATSTSPATATFVSKGNMQDVTDPLNIISLGGNALVRITITDRGEPGSNDTIGITVYDGSGALWHSNHWIGGQTVEKILAGGNLVVH